MKIKKLHDWNISPKEAVALQKELALQVKITACDKEISCIAGIDISFSKAQQQLYAAVVVIDLKKMTILEIATHQEKATFPYVSGLLAFREIPALLKAFEKLRAVPHAVMCDGQGIAHPRGLGLASHLGLWLDLPTIGCAKSRLVGDYAQPQGVGNSSFLMYKNKKVGEVLRSKNRCNPLFISPGHLIDIEGSLKIVKMCLGFYRLPEPTRQAHLVVNQVRVKNVSLNG